MSNITWERRHEAFKALWERLDALTKALDSVTQDLLLVKQATRTNLKTQPEREDLVSFGGVASPNNAGVQVVAGVAGEKIKVYDAGFSALVDGYHCFYFGTSTALTSKRFCLMKGTGTIQKTFVQPRIGADGDGLYIYSNVAETNMPFDLGYVQEA